MDYINILAQLFAYLASLVLFFWLARTLYVYYKNIKEVEAIHKLEAKVAVLRMLLRAKFKKHSHAIETQFRKDKDFLELIRPKLEEVCHYEFTSTGEYDRVILSLDMIYDVIDVELKKKSPSMFKNEQVKSNVPEEQKEKKWFRLVKYGKAQMILIKEIVEVTEELKNMIEEYNLSHQKNVKNKFKVPELIAVTEFDSLTKALKAAEEEGPPAIVFE